VSTEFDPPDDIYPFWGKELKKNCQNWVHLANLIYKFTTSVRDGARVKIGRIAPPPHDPRFLSKRGYERKREKEVVWIVMSFCDDGFKTSNHHLMWREPVKNPRFNIRLFDFSSPSEICGYASETRSFDWLRIVVMNINNLFYNRRGSVPLPQ